MPSLCSYLAIQHQDERTDKKCPGLSEVRWSASAAVINKLALTFAGIITRERFEIHRAVKDAAR
jgi:hypothetical protein